MNLYLKSMLVDLLRRLGILLVVLSAAGCGGSDESSAANDVERGLAADADPLLSIPADELYGASPVDNLWSPRIELELSGLQAPPEGLTLAILSDFHLGVWEGNDAVAAAAVRLAVSEEPDLVVMLGDYLARGDDPDVLRGILEPLRGQRVVAVLGDHDVRSDSVEARVVRTLGEAGVEVLRNSVTSIRLGGATLNVAGVDPEIISSSWEAQESTIASLAAPGSSTLLLTHAPAPAGRLPDDRYFIILGGHTFCGSVEVPGTPRLSWLREQALPGAVADESDRLFQLDESTLLVTCGTGYGYIPLRFGAAPEVPILTLVGTAAPPNTAAADTVPLPAVDTAAAG